MDRPPYRPIEVFVSWGHTLNSFVGDGFYVTDVNINKLETMRCNLVQSATIHGEFTEDMQRCLALLDEYLVGCYLVRAGGRS